MHQYDDWDERISIPQFDLVEEYRKAREKLDKDFLKRFRKAKMTDVQIKFHTKMKLH